MQLNEEQMRAVEHPLGNPACLIAGAGSGKTRCLTERVRWLINQGVQPSRICCVTFTNKAAAELLHRLDLDPEDPNIPKVSTIHSLALSAIRKNPIGFGLRDKATPLDGYDQSQMIRKIVERTVDVKEKKISLSSYVYGLIEKIEYHRSRGLGFRVEYTDSVHERAQVEHAGYHAMEPLDLQVWEMYEAEKRSTNTIDFSDMLCLFNRRVDSDSVWRAQLQKAFDVVLIDESQDMSFPQWSVINGLLSPSNPNLMAVGDISQCQPSGTNILLVDKYGIGEGNGNKTTFKSIPIEAIYKEDNPGAVAWTKVDQRTYNHPRSVKVASRPYVGKMLMINTEANLSTKVTPNHWLWVRLSAHSIGKHLVYMMYREGLGYRVGTTCYRKGKSSRQGFGLTARLGGEHAHKAWILKTCDSRAEAETWEEIYSLKYGIPECVFRPEYACVNKTSEQVKLIFSYARPNGAEECLKDHGLSVNEPFAIRSDDEEINKHNRHYRGYFKVTASHVANMAGALDIPLFGTNKSTLITSVSSEDYEGLVYSLDVEKEHTYIADGLVVGNSIMGFNGSAPHLLKEFSEGWRGYTPTLYKIAMNHRSLPRVVYLANRIQSKMHETIPLKMDVFRGDSENKGTLELMRGNTPSDIALNIASDIAKGVRKTSFKDVAILVRSARQIMDVENALVRYRIPYVIRGGRGLLQTEEIRDILAYLRLITNPKDFTALTRAISVPKRGQGDVALEKIRRIANEQYDGDLIKGSSSIDKLSQFVQSLQDIQRFKEYPVEALNKIVLYMDYKNYISKKYKKEPDKITSKMENIERFKELVRGLSEDQKLSTEDLVFQLTMEKPSEDDTEGQVTISTIHSAKGLEWGKVFLTNVTEGSIPHTFSMGSPAELEEEKRLLYVACTRARDSLTLCVPAMEQKGSNMCRVAPSRFLVELGLISE
jgi:DNA helicase-2/ATP-dependent DNA helicase PcrA